MVIMMTEKHFTIEEMYQTTNSILLQYATLFKNGQISFAEYTLIENIIFKIQATFDEKEGDVE